jgi:hypothetical protein
MAAAVWQPRAAGAADEARAAPDIEVFSLEECPYCAAAAAFLAELRRERPALRIEIRDIAADPEARQRLRDLAARHGGLRPGVPAFFIRGRLIIGFGGASTTGLQIRSLLDAPLPPGPSGEARSESDGVVVPVVGRVSAEHLGIVVFTVILGLVDGLNPCAMWVLFFVLSLLANLNDRLRMLAVAGTFVLVSGLAYFAFMAAWLNVFLLAGAARSTQVALGMVALVAGLVNLKDFAAVGRGPTLRIPERVKPGIYARVRGIVHAERLLVAIGGAAILAVLVNVVELLCTAGLPAVYTRILTLRELPTWQYYALLGLYNAAYMADDSAVLAVAVVTLSHRKLQERGGRWLKLLGGVVMVVLGTLLLLRPAWLATPFERG